MATSQGATPANLYSGGNVVLNAEPFVAFQTNLLAREQAKHEAIDNGYRDMLKGLTPAGLRSIDVAPFVDKVNGLQSFYQQNQDKIKNPRLDSGAAQTEFNSRYNDALGFTQQSKKAVDRAKQFMDFKQKAQLAGTPITDKNLQDFATDNDFSINDPRHKEYDNSLTNLSPKPLDLQKHLALYSNLKPSNSTDAISASPDDPSKNIVTTTAVFSPDDVKAVSNRAQASYQTDPAYKTYIDKLAQDPTLYKQYNDLYNHVMGKNFDIGHPEELAFTHDLALLQKNNTSQKIIPNEKYIENQKFQHQIQLKQTPSYKDKQDEGANLWTIPALQDVTQRAIDNPTNKRVFVDEKGIPSTEYELPSNPLVLKSLTVGKEPPDAVYYNPDTKQYRPVYYKKYSKTDEKDDAGNLTGYKEGQLITQANGNKITDNSKSANPLSGQDVIEALAGKTVGKKYIAPEINSGLTKNKPNAPISAPIHTREDFKSAGWTDDQITKAVKAGKIKIR